MEVNKLQCPQCGSTTTTKVSEGVYHCPYCESNFNVEVSKADMISNILKMSQETSNRTSEESKRIYAEKLAQMKAGLTPEQKAAMKRRARIALIITFGFIALIGSIVFFSVRSAIKNAAVTMEQNASVSKFCVFSGSKGPVIWMVKELEGSISDSVHHPLQIINPSNGQVEKEMQFIPAMTWEDNFNSGKYIGEIYSFGDTCWMISEHDILTARDIYSGKIIITVDQLAKLYPELSKGITKAEWGYSDHDFTLTTNDGFEYIFNPDSKKIIKKEDAEKHDEKNRVTKNFFILSDSKRPSLFKTVEKAYPNSTSSDVFESELENYVPGKRPDNMSDNVISITQLFPDKTYFNGFIEYADNEKALVLYQNSIAKKSALHISCVNADGKELWDFSGKETKPLSDVFSDNNRGINFVYSKTAAIVFCEYDDHNAIAFDWNTGKVLWSFSTAKK